MWNENKTALSKYTYLDNLFRLYLCNVSVLSCIIYSSVNLGMNEKKNVRASWDVWFIRVYLQCLWAYQHLRLY